MVSRQQQQQMFFWKKNGGMIVTGKYCDLQQELCFTDSWARMHTNGRRGNTEAVCKSWRVGRSGEQEGGRQKQRHGKMLKKVSLLEKHL